MLTLSGSTSYTGGTTDSSGTLQFELTSRSNDVGMNLGPIAVASLGTLQLNSNGAYTGTSGNYSANTALVSNGTVFTGNGTIVKTGSGIIDIWYSGSGTTPSIKNFAGLINIQQGVLANQTGSDWSTSSGSMSVNIASGAYLDLRTDGAVVNLLSGGGTIGSSFTANMPLTVGAQNGNSTFGGVIQNTVPGFGNTPTLNLKKTGTGLFVLTGPNTYVSGTTVSGGTLQVGNGGTTGSLSNSTTSVNTITNNATLAFNRSDTITQGARSRKARSLAARESAARAAWFRWGPAPWCLLPATHIPGPRPLPAAHCFSMPAR
jgi:autotransporter-associated beta strand protein